MALTYSPNLLPQAGFPTNASDPGDASSPNKVAMVPAMALVDAQGNEIGTAANPVATTGNTGTQASPTTIVRVRSAGTSRSATVTTTAANLFPVSANRNGFWIKNDSSTDIWVNPFGTAVANAGGDNFRIPANGGYWDGPQGITLTNAISAVTLSGTAAITAAEG